MRGCRGRFTCWLVKMFTTAGIALRAASLYDAAGCGDASGAGSFTVTTSLRGFQATRSGRNVETTKSTARQIVAAWAKTSQNRRIGVECLVAAAGLRAAWKIPE